MGKKIDNAEDAKDQPVTSNHQKYIACKTIPWKTNWKDKLSSIGTDRGRQWLDCMILFVAGSIFIYVYKYIYIYVCDYHCDPPP